jgi:hypothetical protein
MLLGLVALVQAHHPHDVVTALAASADGQTLLASCRSMLYRSSDAGDNWQVVQAQQDIRLPASTGLTALAISPRDPRMALLYTAQVLWRSVDGGVTFQTAALPPITLSDRAAFLATSPPESLLHRSPTAAAAHETRTFGPALHYVAVHGSTDIVLLITIDQRLIRSTDSGESWLPTALSRVSALLVLPRSESAWPSDVVLAGSCDGTIHASYDAGKSWAVAVGHTGSSPPPPPLLSPPPQSGSTHRLHLGTASPPPSAPPPSAPPLCHADAVSSLAKGLPDHCESSASSTSVGTATILPLYALTAVAAVIEAAHRLILVSSAAARAIGCSYAVLTLCFPRLLCAGPLCVHRASGPRV